MHISDSVFHFMLNSVVFHLMPNTVVKFNGDYEKQKHSNEITGINKLKNWNMRFNKLIRWKLRDKIVCFFKKAFQTHSIIKQKYMFCF